MTIFLTSDTHFGHRNIIKYSARPFGSVEEMNEVMVDRWNEAVSSNDVVYHLGDFAMGKIDETLPIVSRLNGRITLIVGNHDRPFLGYRPGGGMDHEGWRQRYIKAGFHDVRSHQVVPLKDNQFAHMSHFPYAGDSHSEEDRWAAFRPIDVGEVLLHGHTHSDVVESVSSIGTRQVHVGVDAWNFRPVALEDLDIEI